MLRRTAARAFGSGGEAKEAPAPAPHARRREDAAEKLFRDIADGLKAAGETHAGLVVTGPRPLASGIELVIEGPGGAFVLSDTLRGTIDACRRVEGRDEPLETLAVQLQAGSYRPVRKPRGHGRSPFWFTSAPDIVRDYVRRARGIQKIDTFAAPN